MSNTEEVLPLSVPDPSTLTDEELAKLATEVKRQLSRVAEDDPTVDMLRTLVQVYRGEQARRADHKRVQALKTLS